MFRSRAKRNAEAGYSVVDDHLTVRGELETEGTVRVDGHVEGRLHRVGVLIVGPAGSVTGDIEAREVVVAGAIVGSVRASKRIEVQATAKVAGDVSAGAMQLHEGGVVQGHIVVASAGDAGTAAKARPGTAGAGEQGAGTAAPALIAS
ncbi:MAG TPA: polymer-forming cytoskeletal protein [Gemmatimonadaceae bacterium]|nr:polymer-forming cytoskeletal protein [Gemmatimonadaceae bacterium]